MREGQRLQPERYKLIPRSLVFLIDGDHIMLLRVPEDRGAWAGRLNGIGGHIERGEHPLRSALREVREETGLELAELRLCGVVAIDSNEGVGIGLYVFAGRADSAQPLSAGPEGKPLWIPLDELDQHELVEDLPLLIPRALAALQGEAPFIGLYTFGPEGQLHADLEP